jgi:hypothetical protein
MIDGYRVQFFPTTSDQDPHGAILETQQGHRAYGFGTTSTEAYQALQRDIWLNGFPNERL